uniref:Uncharacterized protein n=1 Tax=Parascaris univalens TaxID=6257 RepID=A0A915C9U0_PARUN
TNSLSEAKIGNLPTGNDVQLLKDYIGNNENAIKKTKIIRQSSEFTIDALNNREAPHFNTKNFNEKEDDNDEQLETLGSSPELKVGQPLCDQHILKNANEMAKDDAQLEDDKGKLNSTTDKCANEESRGGDVKQITIQKSESKSSTTKESENSSDSNSSTTSNE